MQKRLAKYKVLMHVNALLRKYNHNKCDQNNNDQNDQIFPEPSFNIHNSFTILCIGLQKYHEITFLSLKQH